MFKQTANGNKLYEFCKKSGLNNNWCQLGNKEVGCAETVRNLVMSATAIPIINQGMSSTAKLYKVLKNDRRFFSVEEPLAGDIIISPTIGGSGKLTNGHTGIVGENGNIMSNDSRNGLLKQNYTLDSWKKRYVDKGGYKMEFFRIA